MKTAGHSSSTVSFPLSRAVQSVRPSSESEFQLPGGRQGRSRWRGGRYRVVSREIPGAADVVWVIGKGDSCDPFTQNDAGRPPASQLLRNYHAQIPAGGDRVRQVFW